MEEEIFDNLEEALKDEKEISRAEEEIKREIARVSASIYIIEMEEKLLPAYDKFVHGVAPAPSVIFDEKSVDYSKLFSYLGNRITTNMYENSEFESSVVVSSAEDEKVIPVELKTIEAGIKKVKYLTPGNVTMDSPVPFEGMTSDEYEKFRMWKVLNPGMVKFYMDTM